MWTAWRTLNSEPASLFSAGSSDVQEVGGARAESAEAWKKCSTEAPAGYQEQRDGLWGRVSVARETRERRGAPSSGAKRGRRMF